MTPAEEFRALIDQIPPLERQQVLASVLEIDVRSNIGLVPDYIMATGTEVLRTIYPVGGTWRRKIRKQPVVRHGISPTEAFVLARERLLSELVIEGTDVAIARPEQVPGLIVGWCVMRGDALVLCYTQEDMRRCGVQRMLMDAAFAPRPKYHLYQPRGSAEFLRRLGTELAR